MLPDSIQQLDDAGRRRHALILIVIAASDGELVREEISAIEAAMGLMMIHPNVREEIRGALTNPPQLDSLIQDMDLSSIRLALRDGAIVAAVDGEYDDAEIEILQQLANVGKLNPDRLTSLLDWVRDGWLHNANGRHIISCPLLGDTDLL